MDTALVQPVAERHLDDQVASLPLALVLSDDASAVAREDGIRRANDLNVPDGAVRAERELNQRLTLCKAGANRLARVAGGTPPRPIRARAARSGAVAPP